MKSDYNLIALTLLQTPPQKVIWRFAELGEVGLALGGEAMDVGGGPDCSVDAAQHHLGQCPIGTFHRA